MLNTDFDDFHIISDTWFGRPQILQIANRAKFSNIDDMNKFMIREWNKKVAKDDLVIHLGNFAWDPVTARNVLKKLNGIIIFLLGNSDDALLEVIDEFNEKAYISEMQIIELTNHDAVISHYPLSYWPGKDTGTIHLHGHMVYSHKTDLRVDRRINACCDFWSYSPVKYSTLKDIVYGKI